MGCLTVSNEPKESWAMNPPAENLGVSAMCFVEDLFDNQESTMVSQLRRGGKLV